MTFLKTKKVIMLSACYLAIDARLHCMDKSVQMPAESHVEKRVGGKKLICPEMDMLNSYLEVDPLIVVRMEKAYAATLKAAHETSVSGKNDKQFVAEQIKSILAPVKQFFGKIREFGSMVRPLVEKSLLSGGVSMDAHIDRANCLILKFLESKDDTDTFFVKNVNTRDELIGACVEFATFFEDIRTSLSDNVKKAYYATLEKLKNNAKQSTARKPAGK